MCCQINSYNSVLVCGDPQLRNDANLQVNVLKCLLQIKNALTESQNKLQIQK